MRRCARCSNYVPDGSKRSWCETCRRRQAQAISKSHAKHHAETDPTDEELDAIIAEQRKRLPIWWPDEFVNAEYDYND